MSSGNIISGLTWARTTTTLTITSTAHGLLTGDYVVLRNFNVDYVYAEITVTDSDTFTAQVTDTGGTSGTTGVYIPAFDVSALNETTITIVAPNSGNCQLMSMAVFINASETGTYTLTVPTSITNGAGTNGALNSLNVPNYRAYNVSNPGSSVIGAASLTFSTSTGFGTFTLSGGLDTFGEIIHTFEF
jgi:hypothetical protein